MTDSSPTRVSSRTRLALTVGTLLAMTGIVVVALALSWLGANWSTGTHLYDPTAPRYEQVAAAKVGMIAGAAALLAGVGIATLGLLSRRRVP